MKVLALYTKRTQSLIRRVLSPYGALTERGHSFTILGVTDFMDGIGHSYDHDLTVLPNWVLSPAEVRYMRDLVRSPPSSLPMTSQIILFSKKGPCVIPSLVSAHYRPQ